MINKINSQTNFGSTYVKNASLRETAEIRNHLNQFFKVRGAYMGDSVEFARKTYGDSISEVIHLRDGKTGQDIFIGNDRESDEFIARQITKLKPSLETTYIEDTPETVFEGEPLRFST